MLELGLKVFISYLAGSVNGALLIGQLYGGVDIRKVGSGNAGGTNALRTQGKLFALLVMIVDIGKGVLPVIFLPDLAIGMAGADPLVTREWLVYACGGAAIFGHCYPVWYEFAGGKGAATALGVLAAVSPVVILPAMLAWFGTLFVIGFVGPATVMAAAAVPVYVALTAGSEAAGMIIFTALVAVFIAFTHRSNLRNLVLDPGEPDIRFSIFNRAPKQPD